MLIRSLVQGDVVENEDLNEREQDVTSYEEAIPRVKQYETIIRSKKKGFSIWHTGKESCSQNSRNLRSLRKFSRRLKLVSRRWALM